MRTKLYNTGFLIRIFFFIAFSLHLQSSYSQVEIKGKLEDCPGCKVQAIVDHSTFQTEKRFVNSHPDQYGNFVFDLRGVHEPTTVVIDVDGKRFPVFVKPKNKLWVVVHGPENSVYLSFEKQLIRENYHLINLIQNYGWVGDRLQYEEWFEDTQVGVRKTLINEYESQPLESQFDFLVSSFRKLKDEVMLNLPDGLDPDYVHFIQTYVDHAAPSMMYSLLMDKAISDNEIQQVDSLTLGTNFNPDDRNIPSFIPHIKAYVAYRAKLLHLNPNEFISYFDGIWKDENLIPQDLKDEYLLDLLEKNLNAETVQGLKPTIQDFTVSLTNLDQMADLLSAYEKALAAANGRRAPNFTLQDTNGNKVSLSSYKGQNVFLAFWSSNCRPCMDGMSKSIKNKESLMGDNIKFIYVSTDSSQDVWMTSKYVVQAEPNDVHLWVGKSKPELQQYNAISLPTYYFIDKAGMFVTQFPKSWEAEFVPFVKSLN